MASRLSCTDLLQPSKKKEQTSRRQSPHIPGNMVDELERFATELEIWEWAVLARQVFAGFVGKSGMGNGGLKEGWPKTGPRGPCGPPFT